MVKRTLGLLLAGACSALAMAGDLVADAQPSQARLVVFEGHLNPG